MAFLYEKIDALREYGSSAVLPSYIPENLNPNFELRPYQKQAFENFITHFESSNCPRPTPVSYTHLDVYKRQVSQRPSHL